MSSKKTTNQSTNTDPDDTTPNPSEVREVTAKYSTGTGSKPNEEPSPSYVETTSKEVKQDMIGVSQRLIAPQQESTEKADPTQPDESTNNTNQTKYGHLVSSEHNHHLKNSEQDDNSVDQTTVDNPKGNYHSEIRYFERASFESPDAPESLQEAWRTGVRVDVHHHDDKWFYTYAVAKYNEPANVVLLANEEGMIKTVLNIFENSMYITTAHLNVCENPDCGRYYNGKVGENHCHWCGYSKTKDVTKTEAALLPKKGCPVSYDPDNLRIPDRPENKENHTFDTTCDDCGEVFNSLTRLRLHDCG